MTFSRRSSSAFAQAGEAQPGSYRALAKTSLWGKVDAAYDEARELIQVREYAVNVTLRNLK